ncbi:spherulation-specific family 4 protein [Massilia pseudoviolaceinigra]|uniref:spherulation-specific family 4 protein n=1 Tax=Massilia pseudoviolaceinigra TaxID=3057165 RepID=UPI00279695AE|nr:spherulation-specific family 4 protein [Massilia sp. CCM 9206]MDQ1924837.1 spherulation-specific family 4 protein [Massilia sp. CCM 9206]
MKQRDKKLLAIAASVLTAAALSTAPGMAHAGAGTVNFGMVAYWGEVASTYGGQIPSGAYVVINPNSGALGLSPRQMENYKAVIANIRSQGGKVLGYVATGYDQNTMEEKTRYAAIDGNVRAYKHALGGVDGYFFDEAAFDDSALSEPRKCDGTVAKWRAIRATLGMVGEHAALTVWNAGWPGTNACFIGAAQAGEHAVMYEAGYADYASRASWLNGPVQSVANAAGVKTWVLVHSANQAQMQQVVKTTAAHYVYVTSMTHNRTLPWGGPIWNYTASYWGNATHAGSERWCLKNLKDGGSC